MEYGVWDTGYGVTDMIDLEKSIWGEVTLRGMASSGILNMWSQCPGQAVLLGESFTLPPLVDEL